MPFKSKKEVIKDKLECLKKEHLTEFCISMNISYKGSATSLREKILINLDDESKLDTYIKSKYAYELKARREKIPEQKLIEELRKVETFEWGSIQGRLDDRIQGQYVRKYYKFNDLIAAIENRLHKHISNYVTCTWYNYWTTLLIEDHISEHNRVIPTLKNVKGIDLFFDGQPFDLKISYIPKNYDIDDAQRNPKELARWMYVNQSENRFGSHNRIYIILSDKNNPEESWRLKRDFNFLYRCIDDLLNTEKIKSDDEIEFSYKGKLYTAVTKLWLIIK